MIISLTGSFLLFAAFCLLAESDSDIILKRELFLKKMKIMSTYPLFFGIACIPMFHLLGLSARFNAYSIVFFLISILPFFFFMCCIIFVLSMRKTPEIRGKISFYNFSRLVENLYTTHILLIIFSTVFYIGMRNMLFLPCPERISQMYDDIFAEDPAYAQMDAVRTFPGGKRTILSTLHASWGFSPQRQRQFQQELTRLVEKGETIQP